MQTHNNIKSGLFCFLFFFFQGTAQSSTDLATLKHQVILDAQFQFIDSAIAFEQLDHSLWKRFSQDYFNLGVTGKAIWLKFSVKNTSQHPLNWILVSETPYLDEIILYTHNASSGLQTFYESDGRPFSERSLYYRNLGFKQTLAAGSQQTYYLKAFFIKPDSLTSKFYLYSEAEFNRLVQEEALLFGAFYGAMLIMAMMALLVCIFLRHRNALYYFIFLSVTILVYLKLNGLGFQYLWPNSPNWHNQGYNLVFFLFGLASLQFTKIFLNLKVYKPKIYACFNLIQWIDIAGIFLWCINYDYKTVLFLSYSQLMLLAVLIPYAGYVCWRSGINYARYCFIAWLLYAIGLGFSLVCSTTSWLDWGMSSLNWVQLSSLLEVMFLMLALTQRMLSRESDHNKALKQAKIDALTGVGNRRMLETQWHKNMDSGLQKFDYMLMLDLDHFKQINDSYGHDAGDAVLRSISQLIQSVCRSQDLVVRFGGEEFILLIKAADLKQAYAVAERIRSDFAAQPTPYCGKMILHTLSIGIADLNAKHQEIDMQAALNQADKALYQAKRKGRDQIVHYAETSVSAD